MIAVEIVEQQVQDKLHIAHPLLHQILYNMGT